MNIKIYVNGEEIDTENYFYTKMILIGDYKIVIENHDIYAKRCEIIITNVERLYYCDNNNVCRYRSRNECVFKYILLDNKMCNIKLGEISPTVIISSIENIC